MEPKSKRTFDSVDKFIVDLNIAFALATTDVCQVNEKTASSGGKMFATMGHETDDLFAKRHIIQWFSSQVTLFADKTKSSLLRNLLTFESRDNSINIRLLDKLRDKVIVVLLSRIADNSLDVCARKSQTVYNACNQFLRDLEDQAELPPGIQLKPVAIKGHAKNIAYSDDIEPRIESIP